MDRIGRSARRLAWIGWVLSFGLCLMAGVPSGQARAAGGETSSEPSGGPASGAPRSRLTISGRYRVDLFNQKNFFLGAGQDSLHPRASDRDRFVTQELTLFPRFILSDNLNLNLGLALAQSIWGWNLDSTDTTTARTTDRYFRRNVSSRFRVDWAFLSYRNAWSGTRWYLGRQKFGPGNLLALDADASGLQAYKDLPSLSSSVGGGYAILSEWSAILRGGDPYRFDSQIPHRGDASVVYAEWTWKSASGRSVLNPFVIGYSDKSGKVETDSLHHQTGAPYLPEGQGYLDARFRPQISSATVLGVQAQGQAGDFSLNFEYDLLKGKDKIDNAEFGPYEMHDVNNGDLKGTNLYADLGFNPGALSLGGALAMGSGDDDIRSGKGNFNYLANQGHFSLLEIWGHGLALNERGIAPEGLGNPYTRGYRGLENTRIFMGRAGYALRPNLRVNVSYALIRAVEAVRPFYADSATGTVLVSTYGRPKPRNQGGFAAADKALGSEMDFRIDWTVDSEVTLTLRGGRFKPEVGAGYLINGNGTWLEPVTQIRLGVEVPIREFSLGG